MVTLFIIVITPLDASSLVTHGEAMFSMLDLSSFADQALKVLLEEKPRDARTPVREPASSQ